MERMEGWRECCRGRMERGSVAAREWREGGMDGMLQGENGEWRECFRGRTEGRSVAGRECREGGRDGMLQGENGGIEGVF